MALAISLSLAASPTASRAATFLVATTADAGPGSLRQAIIDANAMAGADTIAFAIPDVGVPRITLATPLPTVTDPVTIDGTSQLPAAWVELDGQATTSAIGLTITGGASTIRGLVIGGFGSAGIQLSGAGGNVIEGNLIGTDVSGTVGRSPNAYGIEVSGSPGNQIGGASAGSGNVISGNLYGIFVHGGAATGNVIAGNLIGTTAGGDAALPNSLGVWIYTANGTLIGGDEAGAGNVISGNDGDGVDIWGASGTSVSGNAIGVALDGTSALGNAAEGIYFYFGAGPAVVGETTPNRIEHNGDAGVWIADGTGITVRGNTIDANGGLGIDLGGAGVTANDPLDADAGPNGLQNFPVLDPAFAGGTEVSGTLDTTANGSFVVEIFGQPVCDPSGYGEGAELLATVPVSTDGAGHAAFTAPLSRSVDASQEHLTATATDAASGSTSEFSACTPQTLLPTTTTTTSSTTSTTTVTTTSTTTLVTTTTTGITTSTSTTDPSGSSTTTITTVPTTTTTGVTTSTSQSSTTTTSVAGTTSTSTTILGTTTTTTAAGGTSTTTTSTAGTTSTSTTILGTTTTTTAAGGTSTTTTATVPTTTTTGVTTSTSQPSSTTTTSTAATTSTTFAATTTSTTTLAASTTTAPSATSTTTTATFPATTTTTVVPPCDGATCGCVAAPTFDSIACRLAVLRGALSGTAAPAKLRARSTARLARAQLLLAAAEGRCADAKRGAAARKLLRLGGRLGGMLRILEPASRSVPLVSFTDMAAGVRGDATTLARGLVCP